MRLSTVAAPEQKIVRTITWSSGTHQNVMLAATLEYVPPDTLREKQEQEKNQVISRRKLVPMEDVAELNNAIERFWFTLLAGTVQKITLPGGGPVTLREMKCLFSLDASQVSKLGGLDAAIPFDPSDATPITQEEREAGKYEIAVKTKGDIARQNILYLIRVCTSFRQFVEQIIADISHFQDGDWDRQLKN